MTSCDSVPAWWNSAVLLVGVVKNHSWGKTCCGALWSFQTYCSHTLFAFPFWKVAVAVGRVRRCPVLCCKDGENVIWVRCNLGCLGNLNLKKWNHNTPPPLPSPPLVFQKQEICVRGKCHRVMNLSASPHLEPHLQIPTGRKILPTNGPNLWCVDQHALIGQQFPECLTSIMSNTSGHNWAASDGKVLIEGFTLLVCESLLIIKVRSGRESNASARAYTHARTHAFPPSLCF